jgi:hypothetical protein
MTPEHDAPDASEHTATAPRPSPVVYEPATVAACRADYEAGGDIRDRLDQQR